MSPSRNSLIGSDDPVARRRREAAQRALQEAQARRVEQASRKPLPPEQGGRAGPEPTRFGDWELNGIATDF